jgi:hypothetical protein
MSLHEIRKWALFLSIIGFIGIGLFLLVGILLPVIFSLTGAPLGTFVGIMIGLLYIVLAVVYFFPVLFLYKFTAHAKTAIPSLNPNDLALAFKYLKSHYKYIGILTIVLISMYILAIIIFVFVKFMFL